MPKLILNPDEELMYLRQIDRIRDIMPEIEVQILGQPVAPVSIRFHNADTDDLGEEFKKFLHDSKTPIESLEAK